MQRVFHYTVLEYCQSIFKDGEIRVATVNVSEGVKPVVWFTINPDWEGTATKRVVLEDGTLSSLLSRQDMRERGLNPIRIEVDSKMVSLRSWNHYKKNSGEPKEGLTRLVKTAKQLGSNPKHWLVSYENVPVDAVIGVSNWDGAKWQPWRKAE